MQAWRPQCDPQNWSTVEGGKSTCHKEVVLWPQLIPPVLSLLHPPSQYCTHTIIHKTFKEFVGRHVLQTVLLMISSEAVLQRAVCPVTPVPSHCGWSFVRLFTAAPRLKKPPQPQQHTGWPLLIMVSVNWTHSDALVLCVPNHLQLLRICFCFLSTPCLR